MITNVVVPCYDSPPFLSADDTSVEKGLPKWEQICYTQPKLLLLVKPYFFFKNSYRYQYIQLQKCGECLGNNSDYDVTKPKSTSVADLVCVHFCWDICTKWVWQQPFCYISRNVAVEFVGFVMPNNYLAMNQSNFHFLLFCAVICHFEMHCAKSWIKLITLWNWLLVTSVSNYNRCIPKRCNQIP